MTFLAAESDIDDFIARWTASSGNERANFHLFAVELCDILGDPRPQIAQEDRNLNDYTFERTVEFSHISSVKATGRIDLYKKNCFLMEAKQSREKGRPKAAEPSPASLICSKPTTSRAASASANRAWDQLMIAARRQARGLCPRPRRETTAGRPLCSFATSGTASRSMPTSSGQGKELLAVSGPARLPHLHAGAARREGSRAPAAYLAKPDRSSIPRGTPPRSRATLPRGSRERVESARKARPPPRRGCGALPDALPFHDVRGGCRTSSQG